MPVSAPDKPSNFLGRAKRGSKPKFEGAERHADDRIKLTFRLPDGRKANAYGPTAERVMEVIAEQYPGAKLLDADD